MNVVVPLLLIALMVSLNALYVTAEFATVGSRRSRVQDAAAGGSGQAARLLAILQDPKRLDNYVAACQIGITLSSLVAGAYGQAQLTPVFEPIFGDGARWAAVVLVLVLITGLQVVLGELLPKTAALRYPERLATATLPPMRISQWVFRPLVAVFNGSAFSLMRVFRLSVDHSHAHVHSPEELAGLYRASAAGGLIDATERDMLAGILNVEARLVREIMTPRRRIVTVRHDENVAEALASLAGGPHSRFPVIGHDGEIDAIVHLRDLFVHAETDAGATVAQVARPVLAVGEVMTVPTLWRALSDDQQHCAVVVNEFGSVAGMVTLEDAVEEILGEVHDEFDHDDDPIVEADGRVSVRGDVLLELLSERYGLHVQPSDIDTVSGLVWHELGRPPEIGDEVPIGASGTVLRVETLDGGGVGRASFDLPGGDR